MKKVKAGGWTKMVAPFSIFIIFSVSIASSLGCETLPASIHIIKVIEPGEDRTCEGEVAVTKCEGSCVSKVRPSAVSHTGFYKDCQCCRETTLRSRSVTLTKCYDSNGKTLTGDKETYTMTLKEPADCKCYRCGEASTISH